VPHPHPVNRQTLAVYTFGTRSWQADADNVDAERLPKEVDVKTHPNLITDSGSVIIDSGSAKALAERHECPGISRRELLTSGVAWIVLASIAAPALAEQVQKKWVACGKCRTIFYDGFPNKGRCAASGAHAASARRVQLPYDTPEGPRMQGGWRFCHKCNALFFDGYPAKGACPAGGGHQAQGLNFVLRHSINGGSNAFRYCAKCHAMFQVGADGHCPAGSTHEAAGFLFDLLNENSQRID